MTLAQAVILCEALKSPPVTIQRLNKQLELARKVETDLLLQFAWHPEPQRLLGADEDEINEAQDSNVLVSSETWAVVVANYLQLQNVANVTAESLLDESSLFPVPLAHSICAFLREVAEGASQFRRWLRDTHHAKLESELDEQTRASEEEHERRFGATFSEKMEAAINSLLVAVQNVQKVQKAADPFAERKLPLVEKNDQAEQQNETNQKEEEKTNAEQAEEEKEKEEQRKCNFLQFHNYLKDLKEGLNMQNVRDNIEAVITLVTAECAGQVTADDTANVAEASPLSAAVHKDRVALALLSQLYPLVAQYHSLVDWYMRRLLAFHSSLAKTHHMASGLFLTLLTRGYCNPEETEGGGGEGDMKLQDDIQGTGMGDGTGKKDVSDEIDNEDQLVGTNKEEKEENKEPSPEDDDEKGFEMQQDFDGEIEDMPDKGDEKEEDEDDKEEEEEEEMDREMGEIDSEDEEVVDEKMWGSEDEEEDNTRQDGKEKIDRDNTVDADPEGEEEMVAKEDNEGRDDDKDDSKDDDKKKKKEKDEKGKNQEDDEEGDEGEEDEDEKGKKKEDEEQEDEEGDVNDMEDIYEDKGKDVRKEDEFELPEDLDLDGNDKKEEEEGGMDDDMEPEEEEEEESDDKQKDDEDVMDIADDDNEMKEGEGEAKDEEEGNKEDEEKKEEEQEKEDEGEERNEEDKEDKDKEDDKELDSEGEDEKQAGMGGQEAKENEEDSKEEEEDVDKTNDQDIRAEDKEEVANTETQPQGVMHETIRKSANVQMEDQQDQSRPQDDLNQADVRLTAHHTQHTRTHTTPH
jgi:hypothetical protein